MGLGPGIAVSCREVLRLSSDLALLWLRRRPAAAVPIGRLAWELPYAVGAALKRLKKKKSKLKKIKVYSNVLSLLALV